MTPNLFSKGMVLVAGFGFLTACGEPITYPEPRNAAECRAYAQRLKDQPNGGAPTEFGLGGFIVGSLLLGIAEETSGNNALKRCYNDVRALPQERRLLIGQDKDDARTLVRAQGEAITAERRARRAAARGGSSRSVLSGGQLPIPNEFPLRPGDHELWVTLTPEQQARALLFLQDGSTIQSSLEVN